MAQQLPNRDVPDYWYGHPMMGWGGGWGGMIFGPFFMIIVLALVIALAVVLVRWIGEPRSGAGPTGGRPPIDILKERFARGEIDKEEFEERRRVLGE
ncbi:SHOCT domain-containing protein [Sedimentitalea sp. XS_ASV28]|uniref:SHOCT domain-containing protein n=1 Tax=Sedimentitalea sp. XS_ASV28 TaxID=3241296 RepID=UPI0035136E7C